MLCLAFLLMIPLFILPLTAVGCLTGPDYGYHPAPTVNRYQICVHPDGRPVQPEQQPDGKN
jgi:hypothetical protein